MEEEEELLEGELELEGKKKGPSVIVLILVMLIGVGGGGAVGVSLLGGTVGEVLAARELAPPGDDGHGGGDSYGGDDHGVAPEPIPVPMIENIVVNPARSGGSRFLLASIAIKITSAEVADYVYEREVEIRSALLLVLGSKTTDELTDISNRSAIHAEVRETVIEILGADIVADVLIPQFVIQ